MSVPVWLMAFGGDIVTLNSISASHVNPGGTATVGIRMDADGQLYVRRSGGVYAVEYSWVKPESNAGNYECRWVTGGTTPDITPGASGTWLALTLDRTWEESSSGTDVVYSFTLELRRVGGPTLKSVTVNFSALAAP